MMIGRLYTPEDEIDVIHEDLGRYRRRLFDAERARHDGRGCDFVWLDKTILRCRVAIERLERELADAQAAERAAWEALDGAA